jgi:hypothetical protein
LLRGINAATPAAPPILENSRATVFLVEPYPFVSTVLSGQIVTAISRDHVENVPRGQEFAVNDWPSPAEF